ncbi:heterokaryon incompatibility protein-domain-containing protein [Amylocarpus encephaloides]|uniref:Heterokaryon incompatibility protein-domain-containing protein n=1 Tax=Amylocarpus encephaloides TaxID=45428 RepID=A0A9P7YKC2_9HELO|nr:heterokaryon incompatibility protein-domain-containing protein [Amylocarpus encephaloides]
MGGRSVYESLDTIRLFKLSPGRDLAGTLQPFALRSGSCPKFNALSYVWGRPVYSRHINVNGQLLPVLDNLYVFLQRAATLPEFANDTWWWIDSICINQQDEQEKTAQLAIMGQIYEGAAETIVWLGEEVDESFGGETVDCAAAIHSLKRLRKGKIKEARAFRDPGAGIHWAAVERLLRRPWWCRVWTLQEYLISPRVNFYCGEKFISRGGLSAALHMISKASIDGDLISAAGFGPAWNRRRMNMWYQDGKASNRNHMGLVPMLAYLGDNGSSDERDRVYSLLGIAKDRDIVGPLDPTSGVDEIYRDLVLSFVAKYNNLDIILFAHLFNHTARRSTMGTALPSWVPDWRAKTEGCVIPLMASQSANTNIGNFRPLFAMEAEAAYCASGQREPRFTISRSRRVITCEGIMIDILDGVGGSQYHDGETLGNHAADVLPLTQAKSPSNLIWNEERPEETVLVEAITRCLHLGREDRYLGKVASPGLHCNEFVALGQAAINQSGTVHPPFLSWFYLNKDLLVRGDTIARLIARHVFLHRETEDLPGRSHKPLMSRWTDTVVNMARRLAVTNKGYIGMAPSRAQQGDAVCILHGCNLPILLRPRGDGSFELIGEYYLDGFMNGEAFDKDSGIDTTVVPFTLA